MAKLPDAYNTLIPYIIGDNGTHAPHMAPKEWIDKFKGQFRN